MPALTTISLPAALLAFEQVYLPARRYTPKTQEEYGRDIAQLVDFLESLGVTYADEVDLSQLKRFVAWLNEQGQKASTQARKVYAIKVFFRFLVEDDYVKQSPAEALIAPTVERLAPATQSIATFEEQLAQIKRPRDQAMFLLLKQVGLRQSELVELALDDLELLSSVKVGEAVAGAVWVRRSGKMHQFVLDTRCWLAVTQWLEERREIASQATTERSIFLNRFGIKLSPRGVRHIFDRL